jgi:energy-coupling factor transporter ATP-binding protein EcfA2
MDQLETEGNESELGYLPKTGERVLVVGQTGSGKSEFIRWLIEKMEDSPAIIYDTKIEPKYEALPKHSLANSWSEVRQEFNNPEVDYVIFRPPTLELNHPEMLDEYLQRHYDEFSHTPAVIDETYQFHNRGHPFNGLTSLLTRGRSRGITTIMGTQRPKFISEFAKTETTRFYIFRLNSKKDRESLSGYIPDFHKVPSPQKYGHWFYHVEEDQPRQMAPIPLEKGRRLEYVDPIPMDQSTSRLAWIDRIIDLRPVKGRTS